jgi:hypothetical protein
MTYELWDLVSRNMIDWFESRREAVEAVQAYVDAGEAHLIALIQHRDAPMAEASSLTGSDLVRWLEAALAELRPTA